MKRSNFSRQLMILALPLLALGALPAASQAQEPAPPARHYPPNAYGPPPAGYGFRQRAPVAVTPPASRNGCGVFRYWDGKQCLDARDTPPKLD